MNSLRPGVAGKPLSAVAVICLRLRIFEQIICLLKCIPGIVPELDIPIGTCWEIEIMKRLKKLNGFQ